VKVEKVNRLFFPALVCVFKVSTNFYKKDTLELNVFNLIRRRFLVVQVISSTCSFYRRCVCSSPVPWLWFIGGWGVNYLFVSKWCAAERARLIRRERDSVCVHRAASEFISDVALCASRPFCCTIPVAIYDRWELYKLPRLKIALSVWRQVCAEKRLNI